MAEEGKETGAVCTVGQEWATLQGCVAGNSRHFLSGQLRIYIYIYIAKWMTLHVLVKGSSSSPIKVLQINDIIL